MVSLDRLHSMFEEFIKKVSKSKNKILEKRDIQSFRPFIELLREKDFMKEAEKLSKVARRISKNKNVDEMDIAELERILKEI